MKHIHIQQLLKFPKDYRTRLVNSLSGFKSANLIGSRNNAGVNNVAIFSSVFHLGADPALVGFITRPNVVERHTLENIQQNPQFTINQVNQEIWQQAHQTSARYDAEQCEFAETGLSIEDVPNINAPFVAESKLKYALQLREVLPIELNNTLLIIGEITDIICQQTAIQPDGYVDIEALNTVMVSGLDSYHTGQRLSRLSYAKPHQQLLLLDVNGAPSKPSTVINPTEE